MNHPRSQFTLKYSANARYDFSFHYHPIVRPLNTRNTRYDDDDDDDSSHEVWKLKILEEEGRKIGAMFFPSGTTTNLPYIFGEISFLEHYQKRQRRAQNKTGRWTKTKVPAYRKTIKARHENPLVHTHTHTHTNN